MSQRCKRLHFNCVSLIQRSVQNTRRIDALNLDVLVLSVSYVEILCGKRHGGNFDLGSGHFVDQTRFTNIGITKEKNRGSERIDRRKSSNVFSNFFQIDQTGSYSFDRSAHSSEGGYLQSLASV
jgi:hypothetical protein